MNWFDFVARMTSSLAWPVAAVALALALRRTFGGWLTQRPSKVKAGPVELEWDRTAGQVDAHIEAEARHGAQAGDQMEPLTLRLRETARQAPHTAIREAGLQVEEALRDLLREQPGVNEKILSQSITTMAKEAHARGLISGEIYRSVAGLEVLQGLVSASEVRSVDASRAWEFIALSEAVLSLIIRENPWGFTRPQQRLAITAAPSSETD
jgi:hypothetical protein